MLLHWALFQEEQLKTQWHTSHFDAETVNRLIVNHFDFEATQISLSNNSMVTIEPNPELWIASVVPEQAEHVAPAAQVQAPQADDRVHRDETGIPVRLTKLVKEARQLGCESFFGTGR